MPEPRDAYKVLQVDPDADLDMIQAAYRRLAQKFHPDLTSASVDAVTSEARMIEINAAWEQIRDPLRRAAYNRRRAAGHRARDASGPQASRAADAGTSPGTTRRSHSDTTPSSDTGSAGPPPGFASGSVLNFGRYAGWSLGEIGRVDPGYLEWLDRMPIGRIYEAELEALLRRLGRPPVESAHRPNRRGQYGPR
jgi:curved DNA-binding protein CbpA